MQDLLKEEVLSPSESLRWLLAVIVAAGVVLLLDHGAVARGVALYGRATSSGPYWLPGSAVLLYGRVPLVTLSALALYLAPGLCLTLRSDGDRSVHQWLLKAFVVSLVVVSAAVYAAEAALGGPVRGRTFCLVLAVVGVASLSTAVKKWTDSTVWI